MLVIRAIEVAQPMQLAYDAAAAMASAGGVAMRDPKVLVAILGAGTLALWTAVGLAGTGIRKISESRKQAGREAAGQGGEKGR
jgi:predicted metal-binding membrane protein